MPIMNNNKSMLDTFKEFISNKRNVMYLTSIILILAIGYFSYDYYNKNYLNKEEVVKETMNEETEELIHEGRQEIKQVHFQEPIQEQEPENNELGSEMFQDIQIEHMEPNISDYEPDMIKAHNLTTLEMNNIIQQLDQSNYGVQMPMYN
jgi:hypothetical protein